MYKLRFFPFNDLNRDGQCISTYHAEEIPVKGDLVFFSGDSTGNKAKAGMIYKVKRVLRCYSNAPSDIDQFGNELTSIEVDVVPTKIGQ